MTHTDRAIEAAAEALWKRIMNSEWANADVAGRSIFLKDARAVVAAFLRAWEPSKEAKVACYHAEMTAMFDCDQPGNRIKAAARAEADRIEKGDTHALREHDRRTEG